MLANDCIGQSLNVSRQFSMVVFSGGLASEFLLPFNFPINFPVSFGINFLQRLEYNSVAIHSA